MEYYGYSGSILYVDLGTGRVRKEPLDLGLARKFVGGPGVGFKLMADMLEPGVDPLSPENVMVFGTGPLVGTLVPGGAKCYLSTKYSMPASKEGKKYFISASMFSGGRFGSMMKSAGYDHVVISGRAERPSYLKVTDNEVEICDARDVWGKDVYEAGKLLKERHRGKTGDCGTWVIGRAGENLVRPSLGWADDWHNAGRFAGAVAGSKNLKAVVTLGAQGIKIADRKRFMEAVERKRQEIMSDPGYSATVPFGKGRTGKILSETLAGIKGCSGGVCACKSIHEVKDGPHKGAWFGGSFAGMLSIIQMALGIEDYREACKLLERMNRDGLCLMTSMNMMSFVTKLYESGVLSKQDMGGLEVKKGDLEFYLGLVEKMIRREDIGAVMAEGWYALCELAGVDPSSDAETGCPITKGIDLLVDARIWPSLFKQGTGFSPCMGLGSVVNAKGKHTHSATYWSNGEISIADVEKDTERMGLTEEEIHRIFTGDRFDTGRLEKYGGEAEAAYNALGICDTAVHWQGDPMRDMPWLAEAYAAATGLDTTARELLRTGERIVNVERLLNVREGFDRQDDKIPPIYLENTVTPLPAREGERYLADWFGRRLSREDLEQMLDAYYEERGWDVESGTPTKQRLADLGLNDIASKMEGARSVSR